MGVRFQKTARGEVAILPRKEYERIAALAAEAEEEDAGTARIVARARREITQGVPLIPIEIADRVADGENVIRALREWRCLTQRQLADATDLGQSYVSNLEKGHRKGTTDALRRIAKALAVPLDALLTD